MSYSIEDIKQLNSVITYAQDHGINIRKEGDRSASFIDPGKNKSCVVYFKDWWYDFKVRQGGDVIDLAALLEFGGDRGQAIRSFGGGSDHWVQSTQNLCNEIESWHRRLTPDHINYLHDRGINEETIKDLKIGENRNRIIIPYWKNGYVCNWIGRTLKEVTDTNPKYFKAKNEGIVQSIPWGLNTLGRSDTLVITEGAFDALSFYQEGYSVLATMGGYFSREQLKIVRSAILSHNQVYLAFDSDKAGQNFATSLSRHLFKHHITDFYVCNIPNGLKDVSDYYQENGEVKGILKQHISGLLHLSRQCHNRRDIKTFLFRISRFVGMEDINILINEIIADHLFDEAWLKEIHKQIKKAPPETMVADEIMHEHNLIYSEAERIHEFNGERWVYKTDTHVKQYIDKDLGSFARNSLTKAVLETIKTRSNKDVEFNKKRLMNFKNGTLELDSSNFRKPKESDYMTIQVDYDYDPNVTCPRFQDYLIEITDNVPEKIMLIQEIFGYVMFPENSLQKCPVLIGEGGNGKSLLLIILEALYGTENVSKVDVSSLISEFQRIQLKDSLINIAPDIKADMKGAEDYFKRVIAGDAINGCYKGEDFINFVPHSKFIISANDMIRPKDTSYGMERRMLFVRFPIKFVDDPVLPDERKADKNLKDKLLQELPGIFNWAYIGYKRLMKNQKFTETKEHIKLLDEFRSGINPMYSFCVDYLADKDVFTTKDAYYAFMGRPTSKNKLVKVGSEAGFGMKLSTEMKKHFKDWEPIRIKSPEGYQRGYQLRPTRKS